VPLAPLVAGTYRPTSRTGSTTWPPPAPAGPYQFAAPTGAYTFGQLYNDRVGNGVWTLYLYQTNPDPDSGGVESWCVNFEFNPPDLTISKTHTETFFPGKIGAHYQVTVTNNGPGPSGVPITVTDVPPSPPFSIFGMTGDGWSCNGGTLTCFRDTPLGEGETSPPFTVRVNVSGSASGSVNSSATVSGGGDNTTANNTSTDVIPIDPAPDLTVTKSHTGNFTQGQQGVTYTVTVSNVSNTPTHIADQVPMPDLIRVIEQPPAGLTNVSMSGSGWTCQLMPLRCSRGDVLAGNSSFPPITVTADVVLNAPSSLNNKVTVFGGGQQNTANDVYEDPTVIEALPPAALSGNITSKTGAINARVWTLPISNAGPGTAFQTQITSFALTQTSGAACTPVVVSSLPVAAGNISSGSSANANVAIDFTGCAALAKFTATAGLSANGGGSTATMVRTNQLR
jgi:hypothetical protein